MDVQLHAQKDKYGLKIHIHVYLKVSQVNLTDVNKPRFGIRKLNNVCAYQIIHIKLHKAVLNVTLLLLGQQLIKNANIRLNLYKKSVIQD